MAEQRPGVQNRAIRLTFAYDAAGSIRLIDRQVIEKRVPPPDAPPPGLSATGISAELRSADGATTFRRVLPQAIRRDVEVFDPDLRGGVRRDPSPPQSGVFTVLVPDDAEAEDVVLLGRAERQMDQGPAEAMDVPAEIGRFELRSEGMGDQR